MHSSERVQDKVGEDEIASQFSPPEASYANVVVNSPFSRDTTGFHYRIAPGLDVTAGQLVLVPFGSRKVQGVVLDILPTTDVQGIKDIVDVFDPQPVLSRVQIELSRWISTHYRSSLLEAVLMMLPVGVSQRSFATLEVAKTADIPTTLSQKHTVLLETIRKAGRIRGDHLKALARTTGIDRAIGQLVQRGLVVRQWELEKPKVKPKVEKFVSLGDAARDRDRAQALLRSSPKQAATLEYLLNEQGPPPPRGVVVPRGAAGSYAHGPSGVIPLSRLLRDSGCTAQTIAALERKGLVKIEAREVWRDPLAERPVAGTSAPTLTPEQDQAWQSVRSSLHSGKSTVFLLQGVTGSGKTEIYLRALEETLRAGKQGIVMVPEIALTPQTIHRFSARFAGSIAVLHSQLRLGEQYDEWRRIRNGELRVVIGSRSAVYAPTSNLGLIIVDEEHEWSYKQEMAPRYNARDVAVKLAELSGAVAILGSATPDLATFHKATNGEYVLLSLPERVVPGPESPALTTRSEATTSILPPVHVVDLRQELRAGNRGIFSRALSEAITLALSLREQVVLYLNRRGTSTFVMCRDCGHVLKCRRCDAALVYHSDGDDLVCHQCGGRSVAPDGCPQCWGSRIKYFGIGTQKVEEETKRAFPSARVVRWDRDTTRERGSHESILQRFVDREADILIGTQMVAKGLDLPKVTLVGVISADTGLHLPDFRAAERTFQLLTQVAGRAGRGSLGGRVIVQTYCPEHYCIQAASRHDYTAFYRQEIAFRRENGYPPFGSLIKLVYTHTNESRCQQEAERLSTVLRRQIDLRGLPATDIVGPAPSFARRVRGKYRWQMQIRGARSAEALQDLALPLGWSVDVDPYTTL